MRVAVFGATGPTGRLLVDKALAAGHQVRVLVRDPSKAGRASDRLEIRSGDALDPEAVNSTISGVEAVVSLLGAPQSRPGTTMSVGTQNVVQAMVANQVRRLVLVSSDGVGDSRQQLPIGLRVGLPFVRKFMTEKAAQERIVRASGLDWTLIRPGQLTDGPETGNLATSRDQGKVTGKVSRSDLAKFILNQLADPASTHRTVQLFERA